MGDLLGVGLSFCGDHHFGSNIQLLYSYHNLHWVMCPTFCSYSCSFYHPNKCIPLETYQDIFQIWQCSRTLETTQSHYCLVQFSHSKMSEFFSFLSLSSSVSLCHVGNGSSSQCSVISIHQTIPWGIHFSVPEWHMFLVAILT